MPKKHLVCHGAICQCKFGTAPDTLVVLTQAKIYVNDEKTKEKLVATTLELGPTFENKTFGTCSVTSSACVPNIILWDGFYDKVTLPNMGNPLLEDSLGTCAIGAAPSIEILFHGQTPEPTAANMAKQEKEIIPLINALGSASDDIPLFIPLD